MVIKTFTKNETCWKFQSFASELKIVVKDKAYEKLTRLICFSVFLYLFHKIILEEIKIALKTMSVKN